MAANLAMLMQVAKAQQQVSGMLGLGNEGDGPTTGEEQRKKREEKDAEEEVIAPVLEDPMKIFTFRMCVYSGTHLPRDTSYVIVKLIDHEGKETPYECPAVLTETNHPVWEFTFDTQIEVHANHGPPRVEIHLYGKRISGVPMLDRFYSSTSLKLPAVASNGPMKQWLKMGSLQTMPLCKPVGQSQLCVVWQVCDGHHFLPDLVRIAEMDEEAGEKANIQVQFNLLSAQTRRSTDGPRKLYVSFKLVRPDGEITKGQAVKTSTQESTEKKKKPKSRFVVAAKPSGGASASSTDSAGERSPISVDPADIEVEEDDSDPDDDQCNTAYWEKEDGAIPSWTLVESRVVLMSYMLEATLYMANDPKDAQEAGGGVWPFSSLTGLDLKPSKVEKKGKHSDEAKVIGHWKEPLGDLMDRIEEEDSVLRCDAQIDKDGQTVASIRLELDIFQIGSPHRMPDALKVRVPNRKGVPPQKLWQNPVQYYCSVFVDGLPNHQPCFPFVRITMGGGSSGETEPIKHHIANGIIWEKPVIIQSPLINRKAKIEVFNRKSMGATVSALAPEDELLAEAQVYDITPDKDYWLHSFGGAIGAPNADVAQQMLKGAVRPPSTYHGSIAIKFGSKYVQKNYWDHQLLQTRLESRLVVRLYSGVNLKGFITRGCRKVKIMVQVAGCRLPDATALRQEIQKQKEIEECTKSPKKSPHDLLAIEAKYKHDDQHYNQNLLMFPGEVNDKGVLRFMANDKGDKPCSWVERSTPKEYLLSAPANVTHAYIYIVAEGEEHLPPTVFGRLRLHKQNEPGEDGKLAEVPPKWKQMRYDESVCDLPEAHFQTTFAGFILGTASLLSEPKSRHKKSHKDNPSHNQNMDATNRKLEELDLPSSKESVCCGCSNAQVLRGFTGQDVRWEPMKELKQVYCHVDVLAARELPAMDEDGLLDPCYRIAMYDKELLYPASNLKSRSPSFMHRICIPFEVEVHCADEASRDGMTLMALDLPMPPVVLKICDSDERKVMGIGLGDTYQEIGTVIVKHGKKPLKDGTDIFPMLGYDETKAKETKSTGKKNAMPVASIEKELNVNGLHNAKWYALDKKAVSAFDASAGGVDESWHKRPRVLLAAGYSWQGQDEMSKDSLGKNIVKDPVAGSIHFLSAKEKAFFEIDVNLLGIRNMPDALADATLVVTSFWDDGKVSEFPVPGSQQNINFVPDAQSNSDLEDMDQDFIGKVKKLIRIVDFERLLDDPSARKGLEDVTVPSIDLKDVLGVRIQAPLYEVPVIPYLQQETLKPGRWVLKPKDSGGEKDMTFILKHEVGSSTFVFQQLEGPPMELNGVLGNMVDGILERQTRKLTWKGDNGMLYTTTVTDHGTKMNDIVGRPKHGQETHYEGWLKEVADPFVLLPAITFQLKSYLTGSDYGTLTVGLNRLRNQNLDGSAGTWMDICLKEYADLDEEPLKKYKEWETVNGHNNKKTGSISAIKGNKVVEDAYDVFVDVFASEGGFLEFGNDLAIGRTLKDHKLFTIYKDPEDDDDLDDDEQDDGLVQYFNPADWMCCNPKFAWQPFDKRIWPTLWCGGSCQDFDGHLRSRKSGRDLDFGDVDSVFAHLTNLQNMDWSEKDRETMPKGPTELYKEFFNSYKQDLLRDQGSKRTTKRARNAADLRDLDGLELTTMLKECGWRSTTKLSCPERVRGGQLSDLLGALRRSSDHMRMMNTHTFMRAVGHLIIEEDTGSKHLCRLRMDLPKLHLKDLETKLREVEEELDQVKALKGHNARVRMDKALLEKTSLKKAISQIDKVQFNYMSVKFREPGMVIWVAPDHLKMWEKPGSPLFVVRLSQSPDTVVTVSVPTFDLRFQNETGWYATKTLTRRFRKLEQKIEAKADNKGGKKNAASTSMLSPDAENGLAKLKKKFRRKEKKKKQREEDDDEDIGEPNGFSRRIPISTGAFVCRLRRRIGAMQYDREQTKNWFHSTLDGVYPEMGAVASQTHNPQAAKDFFLSKFMNLRKPLTLTGEDKTTAGETMLKGHIDCRKVQAPKEGDKVRELSTNGLSVSNLWFANSVYVSVFFCSFTKLDFSSLGNVDCYIFMEATIGNDTKTTPAVLLSLAKSNTAVYSGMHFEVSIPGTSTLTIKVYHQGTFANTLMGETQIDLEDRWMVLQRREFREATNNEHLRRSVWPLKVEKYANSLESERHGWMDPIRSLPSKFGRDLKPSRPPSTKSPLEIQEVLRQDEDTETGVRAGLCRMFIDMASTSQSAPELPLQLEEHEFEVRLKILHVENVKIFKDFGERNDLFVRVRYKSIDMQGEEIKEYRVTQTHKWANTEASWNELFTFKLTGLASCTKIELALLDQDALSAHDLVYDPQVLNCDHLAAHTYYNWRENKPHEGIALQETITFDTWPRKGKVVGGGLPCFQCCRRRAANAGISTKFDKSFFAKLHVQLEIVPVEYALEEPVEQGAFAPPKDRLSMQMLATNPMKTAKVMLGPKLYRQARLSIGGFVGLLTAIMILTIVYFVVTLIGSGKQAAK